MVCEQCGATVEVKGLFPGARVRCACGAEGRVPHVPLGRPEAASPYRRPPPAAPPRPEPAAASALRCPRCRAPLEAASPSPEGERAYGCGGCQGVFLESGALEALRENRAPLPPFDLTREAPPERVSTERYVPCPHCHEIMNRTIFGARSGVVVDACSEHGVWFDRGEIERASRFVDRGGLEGAAPPAAEAKGAREARLERAAAEMRVALLAEGASDLGRQRDAVGVVSWVLSNLFSFVD
ncbi:MAG TPA: zf-TFIIB domain-containing protein [Polyangiaceae bacterium]|nr:zf-TFIIB domain-containing protein [Polyangiaceae bacterium]